MKTAASKRESAKASNSKKWAKLPFDYQYSWSKISDHIDLYGDFHAGNEYQVLEYTYISTNPPPEYLGHGI